MKDSLSYWLKLKNFRILENLPRIMEKVLDFWIILKNRLKKKIIMLNVYLKNIKLVKILKQMKKLKTGCQKKLLKLLMNSEISMRGKSLQV